LLLFALWLEQVKVLLQQADEEEKRFLDRTRTADRVLLAAKKTAFPLVKPIFAALRAFHLVRSNANRT
jgi:hypothetical protein